MGDSWTAEHVGSILVPVERSGRISPQDVRRVAFDLDVWDAWPIQMRDGHPFLLEDGSQMWMALAAPRFADPEDRHGHARIHLFRYRDGQWLAHGPAMPDGFSPGSREWSGSAVVDPASRAVTLYFTATGRRGEPVPSFEQRLFSARADMGRDGRLDGWRDLGEIVRPDPALYMPTSGAGGGIGTIKAFRDPAYFCDTADMSHYLFFAGSQAGSTSPFNGVVGFAHAAAEHPDDWTLHPPLIVADGLNNELERPHMIRHAGLYYLFWSTQRHVFDPDGPIGPTGLYGMVSTQLRHGWRPLNGSGLVFANPDDAPAQAYSWMVLPDLSVASFVDDWAGAAEKSFGGTFAPFVRIWLKDDTAGIVRS